MKVIEMIDEIGIKRAILARSLGISPQLFEYKKNNSSFSESEIKKLIKIFEIIQRKVGLINNELRRISEH